MSDFPKNLCIGLRSKLNKDDSELQTFGCRHSNPDICNYCYLDGVCAFASKDNICHHPSSKWRKIYNELKKEEEKP